MRSIWFGVALLGCREPAVSTTPPHPAPPATTAAPTSITPSPTMLRAAPPPSDQPTRYALHKFMSRIGIETDTFAKLPDGGTEAKAVFTFRDRRSNVPLAASFDFAANGALRHAAAWGYVSRFATIDQRVDARDGGFDVRREHAAMAHVAPRGSAVFIPGYSPVLGQALMLRAWIEHGRPAALPMLPEGELRIESRGKETYERGERKLTLEHIAIDGLVWGREDAWLDKDQLVAVVTRDAEFDHFEAILPTHLEFLPDLARSSGADGVARLEASARAAERSSAGPIALVGGKLIDGTGRPALDDAVVVVDGDRIVAAGPRRKVAIPAGAAAIDVTGMSILPGLWDMHAHVEQVEQNAAYLAAGVTTVRDMANILEFITGVRDAVASGKGLGPRILVDGEIDGPGDDGLGVVRIAKRAEIAPTLDRLKKLGCPEVKIYSATDPALVPAIIAYAHAHGMRAVGHIPHGMKTAQAIEAGYDSISHFAYLLEMLQPKEPPPASTPEEQYEQLAAIDAHSPAVARTAALLVSHRVAIDDTLVVFEPGFFTRADFARREPGIATIPATLAAVFDGLPTRSEAAERAFAKWVELLGELHRRGVVFVAGTDITVPGHSLHRELELYVAAGFTPMEALQAATLVPARIMHMDKELGTVEPGKRADLVIVRGDPLANISDIRKTALVVARGRVYDSAALWRLIGFHPAQ